MIPVTDPQAQYLAHQQEIDQAIADVLRGGAYILGPAVEQFEESFARYIGTPCAVGVANGTDAVSLALRAFDIGPGDEVITVSHTAVATVAAIDLVGATPVLVDIEVPRMTLDPEALPHALTSKTRGVIAVHLYGQPAALGEIESFCRENGLFLIEDCSQAHGARWNGRRVGSIGDVGVFSCYPTKNLGALGDAGVITTTNQELGDKIRLLRQYGWGNRRNSLLRGGNSRLDEMQASVLHSKLPHLDEWNDRRRMLASKYLEDLAETSLELPVVSPDVEHVFHLFVVRGPERDDLIEAAMSSGIQLGIHYPLPVHLQTAYAGSVRTVGSLPRTVQASQEIVSLPMFPELGPDQQASVIDFLSPK